MIHSFYLVVYSFNLVEHFILLIWSLLENPPYKKEGSKGFIWKNVKAKHFYIKKGKKNPKKPQTSFWLKCTCQMSLVFVSHFSTTFFSEFTICQKEKREVKPDSNEGRYMLGSHKQTHEGKKKGIGKIFHLLGTYFSICPCTNWV